jgi:hypothetical protein
MCPLLLRNPFSQWLVSLLWVIRGGRSEARRNETATVKSGKAFLTSSSTTVLIRADHRLGRKESSFGIDVSAAHFRE